jgi:hypothetical protein
MLDSEQLTYARQLYPAGIKVRLKAGEDEDIMFRPIIGKVKRVHEDCSITIVLDDSGDEVTVAPGSACMERVVDDEIG